MGKRTDKASHTAGPWQIVYGGLSEDDEGFGVGSKVEPGIVAECYPPAADLDRRRRLLADARLISAAPDLLSALKAARAFLYKIHDHVPATDGPDSLYGEYDRLCCVDGGEDGGPSIIDAAIRQAEGER